MHILMVRSTLGDSGPGTQPLTLALELTRRGHKVSFATSSGVLIPEVIKRGFPVHIVPFLAVDRHDPVSLVRGMFALGKLIRRENVELLHGHNGAATLYAWLGGLLFGRRLPAVTSVRGVEERSTHQFRNHIWRYLPGKLLAVCENGRVRLMRYGVPRERIVVTYNGVDLTRFDPAAYDREAVRQELGLTGKTVIATTGVMVGEPSWGGPGKGQHLLVQALGRLHQRFPELRVMLIGDGNMRPAVEETARSLGIDDRVLFLGRRFDVPRLLSAVDIYCLPATHGEFFPNSIVEAMAMAKPWVGSDIAGLSELTANGEAGTVVPIGDVAALTAALEPLVADPQLRRKMGERARREVEQRFTIDKVVDRVIEGYSLASGVALAQ
jgi:glycosyltransferase involved in cell wall biosynthesis